MLVNIAEEQADAVLSDTASKLGVRILPKPRLADALDIERSGLSDELYSYDERDRRTALALEARSVSRACRGTCAGRTSAHDPRLTATPTARGRMPFAARDVQRRRRDELRRAS